MIDCLRPASLVVILSAILLSGRPAAAAEPTKGQPSIPASQKQSDAPADDVVKAEALLAEFRTAKSDRDTGSAKQPTTDGSPRTQLEIGRDLVKLGPAAVPVLIKALDDPDPQVAEVSALALGRVGDRRAVEPLLKVLDGLKPVPNADAETPPPWHLRAAACVCALGQLREPRAVAPIVVLERMPNQPSELIERLGFHDHNWSYMCGIMPIVCGDAISRIGEAAVPELVRLLADADETTRADAADYLGRLGVRDDKFSGGVLISTERSVEDESDQARHDRELSERAVSDRVAAAAGRTLIDLLHDKEAHVRGTAAAALGNLRIASAVGPLIEHLKDESPWVRVAAICSLGQIGDPAALDPLAPLLKDPGPDQFDTAELSIAMIGGPKAFALLKSAMKNPRPTRREAAVHGLLALGTPEAVDLLILALKDPDDGVRFDAAEKLGYLRSRQLGLAAVDPLVASLQDENRGVRVAALRSLGLIAASRSVDAVVATLKDMDVSVRVAAVEALGQMKNPKSIEPVKAMLKDKESYARLVAAISLAKLNPPDLAACLRPLLEDTDNDVRATATRILSKPAEREAKPQRAR